MFETLLNLVKENAGDAIINNPAIPNEKNDEAIKDATGSIVSGLQQQLASGNMKGVLELLGGKADVNQHPVTANIASNVSNQLSGKFGLSGSQAGSIVSSLIPIVLGKLISKTNDPGDSSFDMNGIFKSLTGGKTDGIDFGSILSKVSNGTSIDDIAGKVSGSAKETLSTGGIGDMLGGIFGK